MILNSFAGVRFDGTNATIIGDKPGEFVADRNNITRVWMDHAYWPFVTTKLYLNQTGDLDILDQKVAYFKDPQAKRGTAGDAEWTPAYGMRQKDVNGNIYEGTVLEHLLLQNLCAFYEAGEHGMMRLRGADWNDALDMAAEKEKAWLLPVRISEISVIWQIPLKNTKRQAERKRLHWQKRWKF